MENDTAREGEAYSRAGKFLVQLLLGCIVAPIVGATIYFFASTLIIGLRGNVGDAEGLILVLFGTPAFAALIFTIGLIRAIARIWWPTR